MCEINWGLLASVIAAVGGVAAAIAAGFSAYFTFKFYSKLVSNDEARSKRETEAAEREKRLEQKRIDDERRERAIKKRDLVSEITLRKLTTMNAEQKFVDVMIAVDAEHPGETYGVMNGLYQYLHARIGSRADAELERHMVELDLLQPKKWPNWQKRARKTVT